MPSYNAIRKSLPREMVPGIRPRLRLACRPVIEFLEGRRLLSFGASLAGPPEPTGTLSSGSYSFYINTTGSSSALPASSETFHDGNGNNQTFSSPSNPQPVTQSYSVTSAPTASATPASGGGSAVTVPLTLSNGFNAAGSTVGFQVSDPVGSTKTDDNRGYAMGADLSGNIYVASEYNGTSTAGGVAVTEFSNSGALQTGFGTGGTVVIPIDSGKDTPSSHLCDP